MIITRRTAAALAAVALVFSLGTGCSGGNSLCGNAQGKIVEKDDDYKKSTGWDYDFEVLVTRDPETGAALGDKAYTYEVDVSHDVFNGYKNGSRFPGKRCDASASPKAD